MIAQIGGVVKDLNGMNESSVREIYKQAQQSLERIDEERQRVLARLEQDREDYLTMLEGAKSWLLRRGLLNETDYSQYTADEEKPASSNTDIFVNVVLSAGRAIHAAEIWDRALKLGAQTNSPDPVKLVDGTLRQVAERPGAAIAAIGSRRFLDRKLISTQQSPQTITASGMVS